MAWAVAGGSIISGAMSANAAEDAADAQAQATSDAAQAQLTGMREALGFQESLFNFGVSASSPASSMSTAALGAMSQMLGMDLPQVDSHNYDKDIEKYKRTLKKLSNERDVYKQNKQYGSLSSKEAAKWEQNKKTADELRKKLDQARRSKAQQTLQRKALAQFQTAREGGGAATQAIQPFSFDFNESQLGETESYKFRKEQSLEALDRRLAASGMRGSGNRYAGILELASNLASTEYEAEYNRQYTQARDVYSSQFDRYNLYAGMAGMQPIDLQTTASVGGNMANIVQQGYGGMANALMAGGDAAAAGIMGQANAYQSMFGDLAYIGGRAGWFED